IDEVTLNKINELINTPLSKGLKRPDIVWFKQDLMKTGFGTHWTNPSDYYGPDTEKVVKEFQSYYGLEPTGIADEATLAKIDEVISSPYQKGKRSQEIQEIKIDIYS